MSNNFPQMLGEPNDFTGNMPQYYLETTCSVYYGTSNIRKALCFCLFCNTTLKKVFFLVDGVRILILKNLDKPRIDFYLFNFLARKFRYYYYYHEF